MFLTSCWVKRGHSWITCSGLTACFFTGQLRESEIRNSIYWPKKRC